jgi:hypothetical protein
MMHDPSLLTGSTNGTKLTELEKIIKTIELDRELLNTAQSTLSGKMKQVSKASLSQSKEINAILSEMGKLYSILTEIRTHLMPNYTPLPPRPNYQKLRDSTFTKIAITSPNTCTSPIRKK